MGRFRYLLPNDHSTFRVEKRPILVIRSSQFPVEPNFNLFSENLTEKPSADSLTEVINWLLLLIITMNFVTCYIHFQTKT